MKSYAFGNTSRKRIEGVHPVLIRVPELALSYGIIDMTVVPYGGLRTADDQRLLVHRGASKTMKSLHRKQPTGYGHAIDLAPYPLDWNDIDRFLLQAQAMRYAAIETGTVIRWGAVWDRTLNELGPDLKAEVAAYVQRRKAQGKSAFLDYPHFDLGRNYS